MSLFDYTLQELQQKLDKKEINVTDLVDEAYKRIEEVDGTINAFITLDEERAREKAKQLDEAIDTAKERSVLFGMPVGIKDNIVTKDVKTTAASRMLENFVPFYDATVMEKLHDAQAIMIGKQNMDEFSMGSSSETSYFKQVKNPWNPECVPGGSSGGSAAAVAAGEVLFSIGSDTGGSIRQPAAYCGVVGMKPTYGRVSRFGLIAYASSLDTIGPLTRTVEDNAYVLQAIAGNDPRDATSLRETPDFLSGLKEDIKGLKIAVPKEFVGEGVQEEVKQAVYKALDVLENLGATWEEVSLPHVNYALSTFYVLACAEASTSLARYDGIRYGYRSANARSWQEIYTLSRGEGFGEEVKRRLLFGTHVLSATNYEKYYRKAQRVRTLIKRDFEDIFATYDVIVGPTTPTPAFKIGAKVDDPKTMYANDILTTPVNLTGVPAISIPCGFHDGLPLGLQIIGKQFAERTVYRVAHAFEQATDYHKQKPTL